MPRYRTFLHRTFALRNDRILRTLMLGHRPWWAAAGLAGVVGIGGVLGAPRTAPVGTVEARAEAAAAEVATAAVAEAVAPEDANALGVSTSWDLPNLDHPRVDYWVGRYSSDPDMRQKFEGFLRRSGWYRAMIATELAERGMPQDLLYLSMIESGFQPRAFSRAKASGLWQFISETGRRYGLAIDGYVDERNHPERATAAALDYLEELHERFDSWYLAAAAYNTGENRVARIMREEFGTEKAFGEGAYYRIWDRLPRETRDYVPLMIAAARITKDPERYGFGDVSPEKPLEYEEVVTDAAMTFQQIAKAANVDLEQVRLLNPYLRNGRTPGNRRVVVRLPAGASDDFLDNWMRFAGRPEPMSARITHHVAYRVRRGDNLGSVARRHGMTVTQLRRLNGLRSDRIYAGQTLKVAQ
jgi:membrane-bound lytic murein transglycosylase D